MIRHLLSVALNVPWPGQNTALHIQQVCDNIMEFYVQNVYVQLRTEMIMVNHSVQIIQRTWRHAISNPDYAVCQRRLARDYQEIMSWMAEHRTRHADMYNGSHMVDVHELGRRRPCSV